VIRTRILEGDLRLDEGMVWFSKPSAVIAEDGLVHPELGQVRPLRRDPQTRK
jgi:hypothetical protein